MKIGVLTSSRADFGIYLPLLKLLNEDSFFELEIIAFGTHLSKKHGYTLSEIKQYQFKKIHKVDTLPNSDSAEDISKCIGSTIIKFAKFWAKNKFDLVICLGDRYEMFAAVSSSSTFNVKIAHIHAGETTLGAIDNAYRHSISLFSKFLFVSNDTYMSRAKEIVENDIEVFNVGALSIENLSKLDFLSLDSFKQKFDIDLSKPTILSTFHPETVSFEKNKIYIKELLDSFDELKQKYQIVITMPNTDTMGQMVRGKINEYKRLNPEINVIESFGMLGYLSCMKHCSLMIGNTSSGFVEANYFPTPVINLGNRQKGRIETKNILTTPVIKSKILDAVEQILEWDVIEYSGVYGDGNTANKISNIIKNSRKNG